MNEDAVKKMKKLISISLEKEEEKRLMKDFNKIIDYVDKISEIEDDNIDYLENSRELNKLHHEDSVEVFENTEEIKKNFPKKLDDYLAVPKYIGE